MKIAVCIGSSCHLKGSREVVEKLNNLIQNHNLIDKIELSGTFCMENCQNGVSVTLDDKIFSLAPETTESFFNNEVLTKIKP